MLGAVGIDTKPTQCDLCATPTLPSVDKLKSSVVSYNRFDYPVKFLQPVWLPSEVLTTGLTTQWSSYNRFDYPVKFWNHMLKEATQLIILLLDIGWTALWTTWSGNLSVITAHYTLVVADSSILPVNAQAAKCPYNLVVANISCKMCLRHCCSRQQLQNVPTPLL